MSEQVLERRTGWALWLRQLDGLLRGDATKLSALKEGKIHIAPEGMTLLIIVMGVIYGACMGTYALFQTGGPSWPQMLSAIGKVPLLFGLTVLVTLPSLYVFNALVGSRLSFASLLRLIVGAIAVMLTVLASLGPIVAFFSVSTTSYAFMLLLNVVVFTVAGFLGLKFMLHTLHRLSLVQQPSNTAEENQTGGALDKTEGTVVGNDVKTVFRIWIVVFGLVGAQMSWVLRPFLGHPGGEFALFRARESNFFEAVLHALTHL